jgi:hypothetical protein
MKVRFLGFIFLFFSLNIISNCSTKNNNKDKKVEQYFASYFITRQDLGDYFARLYYVNPLIQSNTSNYNLIAEATSANVTSGKKKLVLLHGWEVGDTENIGYISINQLKDRIITDGAWGLFFKTGDFTNITSLKSYDVYAFDYLTSRTIDSNGTRFRAKLDALFSAEQGTVVIYGHSMGGLVAKFAIYQGSQPAYANRVITTGTPFHGSPWASPQYQGSNGVIGSIASFMTNTQGGQDLRWDNFDNSISGASNTKLTQLNSQKSRDSLFYTYYGSYTSSSQSRQDGGTSSLIAGCGVFGTTFSPSDCIVPQTSAIASGSSVPTSQQRNLGRYDHLEIKMGFSDIRATFVSDLP